jgi:hypothetical protein
MIKIHTSPHPFGLIIPMKTGVIWEHQCDGVCCHQIEQEGIFIPLDKRCFKEEQKDDHIFYFPENLPFDYEFSTSEEFNAFQESYDWIIFKGWKDEEDSDGEDTEEFIGKKMLLVYKNSD